MKVEENPHRIRFPGRVTDGSFVGVVPDVGDVGGVRGRIFFPGHDHPGGPDAHEGSNGEGPRPIGDPEGVAIGGTASVSSGGGRWVHGSAAVNDKRPMWAAGVQSVGAFACAWNCGSYQSQTLPLVNPLAGRRGRSYGYAVLILQIAAGIILAVLVVRFWRQSLVLAVVLAVLGVLAALILWADSGRPWSETTIHLAVGLSLGAAAIRWAIGKVQARQGRAVIVRDPD